jgi:hypothetical protein
MSSIANFLARLIWFGILWLMRRKWMKAIQKQSVRILPKGMQERAWDGLVRRNRYFRHVGLSMLKFLMNLVVGSLIITSTFLTAMRLFESGYLTIPYKAGGKCINRVAPVLAARDCADDE